MVYTLSNSDAIIRDSDGAFIPPDPANSDYRDFLAWKEAGNTPAPAPEPPAVPVTQMSPLQFMARIPPEVSTAIATAAQSNASVLLWLLQLSAASYVDVTDPRTIEGVNALVAAGLIPAALQAALLAPAEAA